MADVQRTAPEEHQVRLAPIARLPRLIGFVASSLGLLGLAFAAGWFVKTDQPLVNEGDATIIVNATVEEREFVSGLAVQGTVAGGAALVIDGAEASQSSRPVVTSVAVSIGDVVGNQSLIGTVSDRPVWVLGIAIPMYRDISRDDVGSDVFALQRALRVAETGRFDSATQRALESLYLGAGFEPPGGRGRAVYARMGEIVALPQPATVKEISTVGTLLSTETKLATLNVGPPIVTFRATVLEVDELSLGALMLLRGAAGGVAEAVVESIGTFQQATGAAGAEIAGHDVILTITTTELPDDTTPGRVVTASLADSTAISLLSFPELAIRSGGAGDYVLALDSDGQAVRIPVNVVSRSDGWAGVRPGGDLVAGDVVRLRP